MAEDMDLKMRILARGEQALRTFRNLNSAVDRMSTRLMRVGALSGPIFRGVGRAASLAMRPLKMLAGLTLGLAGTMALLAGKALFASGDIESLKLRIEGVSSSLKEADHIFKTAMQVSVTSPFEPTELAEAAIGLKNIGMFGRAALISVGNAAALSAPNLTELISMLTSLETEPLRRIGVNLKREAGQFEFVFRDKMDKVRTITAAGIDDARKALLGIFDVKYGGGMARFTSAWAGLISTVKGQIKLASAAFGDGMMPAAKQFVAGIQTRLDTLLESGRLKELGAQFADTLTKAWDYGAAVIDKAQAVLDAIVGQPDKQAEAFKIVATSFAETIVVSLVNYLRAMGSIFVGIGKLIAGAFLEDFYDSAMGAPFRKSAARNTIENMTPEQSKDLESRMGVKFRKPGWDIFNNDKHWDDFYKRLTPEQRAQLAAGGKGSMFQSGLNDLDAKLPGINKENLAANSNIWTKAGASMDAAVGDTGPGVDQLYAQRRAQRDARQMEYVTALRRRAVDNVGTYTTDEMQMLVPAGTYERGQQVGQGYRVTNIYQRNVTIRPPKTQRVGDALIKSAQVPQLAAAGAY